MRELMRDHGREVRFRQDARSCSRAIREVFGVPHGHGPRRSGRSRNRYILHLKPFRASRPEKRSFPVSEHRDGFSPQGREVDGSPQKSGGEICAHRDVQNRDRSQQYVRQREHADPSSRPITTDTCASPGLLACQLQGERTQPLPGEKWSRLEAALQQQGNDPHAMLEPRRRERSARAASHAAANSSGTCHKELRR
jgi:hypothetical protein